MKNATKSLPTHSLFVIPASGAWIDVGAGWTNRDGSVNVTLTESVPKGAKLQLRRRKHSTEALAAERLALIDDETRRQAAAATKPSTADTHSLLQPTPAERHVGQSANGAWS